MFRASGFWGTGARGPLFVAPEFPLGSILDAGRLIVTCRDCRCIGKRGIANRGAAGTWGKGRTRSESEKSLSGGDSPASDTGRVARVKSI